MSYEKDAQTQNQCYNIKGDSHKITDNNYYNNYYNRYNHYYITERNYTTDYITDYNVYHYNKENIYNGCHFLGSHDIVLHDQGCAPQQPVYIGQGGNGCSHCRGIK